MTLPTGDALDVLIAEKVMGWKRGPGWRDSPHILNNRWFDGETRLDERHATPEGAGGGDYYHPDEKWSPSTDIRAAMEVVEKLRPTMTFKFAATRDGYYAVFDVDMIEDLWNPTYETAPLAICRAALAAIGGA